MIFVCDANTDITEELIQSYIQRFKTRLPRYARLRDMYLGNHPIKRGRKKELGKPDNRLVVNFAKYIVDTLNGYFVGKPIKTIHPNPDVAEKMRLIAKRNNQNDNNAELSKLCSIYGHAYEFLYQDENAHTRVTRVNPTQAFVVYDNTIAQNSFFAVHLMDGGNQGSVYTAQEIIDFTTDDKGKLRFIDLREHHYRDVPIIEYVENDERQSAFENVETLINAYNKALSEKANDVDYFADAYLAILGVELDEETIKHIKDNRVINLKDGDTSNIVVQFLDKPNADQTQENLIERLERLIFQISMVSNINDETFGTSSGIALRYKLQSMENLSLMKERKFTAGMTKRFKMMFSVPTNFGVDPDSYLDIDYVFSRNIPHNLVEEAEVAAKLSGITSKTTQLSTLSVVDNVQEELEQMQNERNEEVLNLFNQEMNRGLNDE